MPLQENEPRELRMLFDLNETEGDLERTYDLCLVGAGPAGITIAAELERSGLSILLAESGGLKPGVAPDDLNMGESIGYPADLLTSRFRGLGGTSTRWGGRCAMLDAIDFESRDWIEDSGWPLSLDALLPCYKRARSILNLNDGWSSDEEVLAQLPLQAEARGESALRPYVWRVPSPYRRRSLKALALPASFKGFDFGAAYRRQLAQSRSVHVLLNATLVAMLPGAASCDIAAVRLASLAGRRATIRATHFVLCCSGVENARILLNASPEVLECINRHEVIGRYLAQHPVASIGTVKADCDGAMRLQQTYNVFQRPPRVSVAYTTGLALTRAAQQANQLCNASVTLTYEANAGSSWAAFKRLKQSATTRTLGLKDVSDGLTVLRKFPMVNLARRYVLGREVYHRHPIIHVNAHLEQAPNRDSRIYLSNDRDRLGVRRVVMDWRISGAELKTARFLAGATKTELRRRGLGELETPSWIASGEPLSAGHLASNEHHIGTTRMADDPAKGVVDRNCKVHGLDNLFVAGASVFPTGGHANPTLTIVALSIRIADHLRNLLGG